MIPQNQPLVPVLHDLAPPVDGGRVDPAAARDDGGLDAWSADRAERFEKVVLDPDAVLEQDERGRGRRGSTDIDTGIGRSAGELGDERGEECGGGRDLRDGLECAEDVRVGAICGLLDCAHDCNVGAMTSILVWLVSREGTKAESETINLPRYGFHALWFPNLSDSKSSPVSETGGS